MAEPLIIPPETIVNISDPSKWFSAFSITLNAQPLIDYPDLFYPIPATLFDHDFESPIIQITAISGDANNIRYIGKLRQFINTGSTSALSYVTSRPLYRGTQMLRFSQDLNTTYKLELSPNYYRQNIVISISEYIP